MPASKKELKQQYLHSHRPMGVFLIRNNVNDKVFVGASLNLPGIINRHKFALQHGSHASKSLQSDWNELGSSAFSFEIVDELTPRSDPKVDYRQELELLENLWLEKLKPYDEKGYNEKKVSRAERLRKIAERRSLVLDLWLCSYSHSHPVSTVMTYLTNQSSAKAKGASKGKGKTFTPKAFANSSLGQRPRTGGRRSLQR